MEPDFEVIAIVVSILLVVALAASGVLALRLRRMAATARAARSEAPAVAAALTAAQARIGQQEEQLARYAVIADAETAAAEIRGQAQTWAATTIETAQREATALTARAKEVAAAAEEAAAALVARTESWSASVAAESRQAREREAREREEARQAAAAEVAQHLAAASSEAERILADARATAGDAVTAAHVEAERALATATTTAAEVLAAADAQARQTAGDALNALRDSKRLETVVRAMQNVIDGYGDRYVMPTQGLLDELAEELGFSEAGQRLKQARLATRELISSGRAATCEYVEVNRRTAAIDFVLDAFNGKVDTALADVRDDNFGTIEQKIRDAYALVNYNGKPFRDARILPELMAARLNELRWAVVAQELKAKEREEQRVLKERIREEERAQREFEKAAREAQKEEETLQKAMERARRDAEKATDDQRAKFEEQLRLLTAQLHEAQAKNQKALSMAQQTKAGHVYVISNVGSFGEGVFKIGMTRRLEPLDRIRELGDASVPFEFDVHAMVSCDDAPSLERSLHKLFLKHQVNKVNPRKEFFRVPLVQLRTEMEKMGVGVAWTVTSDAREWRETQAIERAMENHTLDEARWASAQLAADTPDAVAASSVAL